VDQEVVGAEEAVEVVDLDTRAVREWVIIHLDLLEMVVEAETMDHMVVQAHLHRQHMARMLPHHKLRTAEQEDTVILDYRPIHTLEAHPHHQTRMLEMPTERLQQHMEDTPHRLHRHYRGMEMERMVLLHLINTLPHATVEDMAEGTEEVVDMVDMAGTEVEEDMAEVVVDVSVRWW